MPDMACDNKVIQWSRRISIAATFHDTQAHTYIYTYTHTKHVHIDMYILTQNENIFFVKYETTPPEFNDHDV